MAEYTVMRIPKEQTYEWLLKKHYAKRIPSISYSFGLYERDNLVGICTFGLPANPNLCRGICGNEWSEKVLELNRLVLSNNKNNEASFFISKCLNMLPKPTIVVSYSDTTWNHHGYIYQALNFVYTGLSAKRTDPDHNTNNIHNRTSFIRGLPQKERARKHRYVMFLGSKKQKKELLASLKYPILPYPKGDNQRYDASYEPKVQGLLL
jgi:hypothetical protein